MKYLWTEDTGVGLHFWHLVNQLFFDGEIIVESKESSIIDATRYSRNQNAIIEFE